MVVPNRKKTIFALHKEFKKFEKGKTVQMKISLSPEAELKFPLKIFWAEDIHASHSWDHLVIDRAFNQLEEIFPRN